MQIQGSRAWNLAFITGTVLVSSLAHEDCTQQKLTEENINPHKEATGVYSRVLSLMGAGGVSKASTPPRIAKVTFF